MRRTRPFEIRHTVEAELAAPRATGRLLGVLPAAGVLLGNLLGGMLMLGISWRLATQLAGWPAASPTLTRWALLLGATGAVTWFAPVQPFLTEHAAVERDVTVVGVGDHLQIWNRDRWRDYNQQLAADMASIALAFDDVSHSGRGNS